MEVTPNKAMKEIPDLIKILAKQMIDSAHPANVLRGTVLSASPLSIQIETGLVLPEAFFVLTHAVKDYYVDISVSHQTENRAGGSGDAEFASHNHDYSGRKKIMIHNGLVAGEGVLLIQEEGGQQFIIIDRIEDPQTSGQWI